MSLPPRHTTVGLLFVLVILAGCGGGPSDTAVSGRLLENGEAVKPMQGMPPGDKGWQMTFTQADVKDPSSGSSYAQIADDGSFRVEGPNKKGLPPGKYRISVEKGPKGKSATIAITDLIEIPRAASVKVEVDAGTKTAKVTP